MKVAKIALSADTRGFKVAIEEAKRSIEGLGQAKISPDAANRLKRVFDVQLRSSMRALNKEIKSNEAALNAMMSASGKLDTAKIDQYTRRLADLKSRIKDVARTQLQLNPDAAYGPAAPAGGGAAPSAPAGGGSGIAGKMFGGMGRALSGLALGAGVMSLVNRRDEMATDRLRQRSLTRDSGYADEKSDLGYTTAERRARATGLAGVAGGIDSKRLSELTTLSEKVERAYGVTGEETAQSVGAARKAGVGDQGKFLANSIGTAVAAGLEGSQIGEYLGAMTGMLGEMSRGVNVDTDSLNGFAGALSRIPFFKNDPNRGMDAMRGLNSTFQNGGAFETAQAQRALLQSAPGAGPASLEIRRKLGLFGGGKGTAALAERMKGQGGGELAGVLGVEGPEVIQNMFNDIMKQSKGLSYSDQAYEFMSRSGLQNQQGLEIFSQLKDGKKIDAKQLQNASMSPEQRLQGTIENMDGSIKKTMADLSQTLDKMATNIGDSVSKLEQAIKSLVEALGGDFTNIMGNAGTGAVVATAAGVAGAGKIAGKAGGALMRGGSKLAGKMGMKGLGKIGAKGAARAGQGVPFLGTALSLGMLAKDGYDAYGNYQRTGKVSDKDKMILGGDALSLVPGLGVAGAAMSIGGEMLPDEGMPKAGPKLVSSSSGSSMPAAQGSINGTEGLEAALRENTMATMQNTAASGSRGTASGRGGARAGSVATGKGR